MRSILSKTQAQNTLQLYGKVASKWNHCHLILGILGMVLPYNVVIKLFGSFVLNYQQQEHLPKLSMTAPLNLPSFHVLVHVAYNLIYG